MFASKLIRCVLAFQECAPTSRMAGPLKDNYDASDGDNGLTAASNFIQPAKAFPPIEEHDQCYGTVGELVCTTRAAKRAYDRLR
jgi:hypothetical protein